MKHFFVPIVLLFVLTSVIHADIDARIEAIRKAPVQERYKMMNAFKKEIIQMQEQERIDALTKLKNITKNKHTHNAIKELKRNAKKFHYKTKDYENIEKTTKENHEVSSEIIENEIREGTQEHTEEIENETEEYIENEAEDEIENEAEEGDDD